MIAGLSPTAADQGSCIQGCTHSQQYTGTDYPGMGCVQQGCNIPQLGDSVIVNQLTQQGPGAAQAAERTAGQAAPYLYAVNSKKHGSDSQKQAEKIHKQFLQNNIKKTITQKNL